MYIYSEEFNKLKKLDKYMFYKKKEIVASELFSIISRLLSVHFSN